MKSLFAALLIGIASPALADAASSFHDGKWAAAAEGGRAEGTATSLVLAGRALLIPAAYSTRDKAQALAMVTDAESLFDKALAKAPNSADAQFQKAIAIGYRAKLTRSPGLGKDALQRFTALRTAHPEMAEGWAAVAGWNAGAISTLGNFMASTVLGAKKSEIEPGFARAMKIEPNSPIHRTIYALAIMDLDKDNAAKAAAALQGVGVLKADDGYEALMRSQGVQLAAALRTGDAKAAQVVARRLQAFGTLG